MQILTFNVSMHVLEGVKMRIVYELKKEMMEMGKVGAEEKGTMSTQMQIKRWRGQKVTKGYKAARRAERKLANKSGVWK